MFVAVSLPAPALPELSLIRSVITVLSPMPRARERVRMMPPKMMRKVMLIMVLPRPRYSKTMPKVITTSRMRTLLEMTSPYPMCAFWHAM